MGRSLILFIAAWISAQPGHAQYFGQNKVQYQHLDFRVIQTEHFDVHYYGGLREGAMDAARMAERAYARLSRVLNHRYRNRQPIILFGSHSEFRQNNVIDIGEATSGVTDALRQRIMLPFTGSYADFERVLKHEMVHQFQYDLLGAGRIGASIPTLMRVQPPLWFMEGMAEYLSVGPTTPHTAMWLRDAALEGDLPSIEEMTTNPRIFPYRFGHALFSFIGERWGDQVIGDILHAVATSGVGAGFDRALRMPLDELSDEWRDAVRRAYLPQIAELQHARTISRPLLDARRSHGKVHISPSISPDGSNIVYLSEGKSLFIDLYLADGETGQVKARLIRSAFDADFESLRFITSAGSWSPDGRFFAMAAESRGRDDLVIYDVRRNRVHTRIRPDISGLANPSWSPDGRQIVFTGYSGGFSDLFIVKADGTGLRRLTNDRYADLHPAWSPDGERIALATDRGPETDLDNLRFGPMRIAMYQLRDGVIQILGNMQGSNINPTWSPDGRSLAFVSDRTGIANIYLYDFDDEEIYQLTDIYTGVSGIAPLSPAISWAGKADRLAFTYYEKGGGRGAWNVYAIDNPRSLKREPFLHPDSPPVTTSLTGRDGRSDSTAADRQPSQSRAPSASPYPFRGVFRSGSRLPVRAERRAISVLELLDSATLSLPDTSEFAFMKYSASLRPDYVVQPTIGYARDNFGRGFFGGTAISLSDLLGNRRLVLGGQVNGRLEEAQALVIYANFSRRINWAVGYQQEPLFFFSSSTFENDGRGGLVFNTRLRRFVIHETFAEAYRPFDRFSRLEFAVRAINVSRATLDIKQFIDPISGFVDSTSTSLTASESNVNYLHPSFALVFDNTVPFFVGPIMGRRSRLEYSPAIGDWQFHQYLADYRRYDRLRGPFLVATRLLFFGRFGRSSDQFPLFLGTPDLLRGYTSGSFRRNECVDDTSGSFSGCSALDQLVGSRIAVANIELRFPLTARLGLGLLPTGFPPLEGALFFDAGVAWNSSSSIVLSRKIGQNKDLYRQPLASWGFSLRGNIFEVMILRADYTKPLSRERQSAYWTVSIGPTF